MDTTLGWSYHRIPNVLTFATLQAGLRPVEAQFGGFSDPERTTGGFRRDICALMQVLKVPWVLLKNWVCLVTILCSK